MTRTSAWILIALSAAWMLIAPGCAATAPLAAGDPAKVAPDRYTVLLENDRVRVLEARDKPGDKTPLHSHPAYLVYVLAPATRKIVAPDGAAKVVALKKGQVLWFEPTAHTEENVGKTDTHLLLVEVKK